MEDYVIISINVPSEWSWRCLDQDIAPSNSSNVLGSRKIICGTTTSFRCAVSDFTLDAHWLQWYYKPQLVKCCLMSRAVNLASPQLWNLSLWCLFGWRVVRGLGPKVSWASESRLPLRASANNTFDDCARDWEQTGRVIMNKWDLWTGHS